MIRIEYNSIELDGERLFIEDLLNLMRLQKQLLVEEKILATLEECSNIWGTYSGDLAASWLDMPKKDEEILQWIKSSHNFTNFEEYAK